MARVSRGPSESFVRSRIPPNFNLTVARRIQRTLAGRVIESDLISMDSVDTVAGLDVAYINIANHEVGVSVASTYSMTRRSIVDVSCWVGEVRFPYIPTLLSFRELKPMVGSYMRLREKPQVVLVDGHGRAHPYRLGIASHFGVCMGIPTVGVAKSLLYGRVDSIEGPVLDPGTGEVIGWALRCASSKPTYVSVGHGVSLRSAVELVRRLCVGSQMPIPILHSHNVANALKRKITNYLRDHYIEDLRALDNFCTSASLSFG
ncbi:endonuclease V [Vulcanisaeta thermophila]|uniref:endonuclease V n=1 Tax=Vulcanisaeta thermophila TaxID=867917 RepID=UPI000853DECF|nr:endonuclease V [Vulcanisaeta thermophila]